MAELLDILKRDAEQVGQEVDFGELNGKSVLLTGATGLIGINLLSALRWGGKGVKNLAIYPVVHSAPDGVTRDLMNFKGVTVCAGDLTDPGFCSHLPSVDYIIHGAGYAQPLRFMEDPLKTYKLNTSTTASLFERLRKGGRFLFLSSSEVYAGAELGVCSEDDIGRTNTTHPRACYVEGKRGGEAICNAYRSFGVGATSARVSLVYGPGARIGDKRVLFSFIEQAFRGGITLMDRGQASRTYCYSTDAVEILLKIMLQGTEPIYNVGGKSRLTIAELATLVGDHFRVPVNFPEKSAGVAGAPRDVRVDISLIQERFRKTRFVDMETGLKMTIEWYDRLYRG